MENEAQKIISIPKDTLELLMRLCFEDGIMCGTDEQFWNNFKGDANAMSNYISESIKSLLVSADIQ